jgi:aspartate kinase
MTTVVANVHSPVSVVNKTKKSRRKHKTHRQRKLNKNVLREIDLQAIAVVPNPVIDDTMKVMKFGGTSVGKPYRMHEVARLITADHVPKIVVLSALSGTTNTLVSIGEALAIDDKPKVTDIIEALEKHYRNFVVELVQTERSRQAANAIVTEHFGWLYSLVKVSYTDVLNKEILVQGELMSTKLFSVYLRESNIDHVFLPALDFMSIDENDEPQVKDIRKAILPLLKSRHTDLFITQGYICKNHKGQIDNLKRGGSDYTASLIAAAINASVCEIWTDIDGMHNNDPRIVSKTRPIPQLSFNEAAELAYFGAKILHPACIIPAQLEGVPVKLLNTMHPEAEGTTILASSGQPGAKAVAAKDQIISINVKSNRSLLAYRFLPRVFEVFEKHRVALDMITTSEVSVTVTLEAVPSNTLESLINDLATLGVVEIERDQCIVCLVGDDITETPDVLSKVFESLKPLPVRQISFGGNRHSISMMIPASYKTLALQKINSGIFGL